MTLVEFTCGNVIIDLKPKYEYLGLWLNGHLDYVPSVNTVAIPAGRAFRGVVNKCTCPGGLPFKTYIIGQVPY